MFAVVLVIIVPGIEALPLKAFRELWPVAEASTDTRSDDEKIPLVDVSASSLDERRSESVPETYRQCQS